MHQISSDRKKAALDTYLDIISLSCVKTFFWIEFRHIFVRNLVALHQLTTFNVCMRVCYIIDILCHDKSRYNTATLVECINPLKLVFERGKTSNKFSAFDFFDGRLCFPPFMRCTRLSRFTQKKSLTCFRSLVWHRGSNMKKNFPQFKIHGKMSTMKIICELRTVSLLMLLCAYRSNLDW